MKLKDRAKKLNIEIPALFIALKEKDTPIMAKILAGITLVYALSPIDLIPDFIPVLGYLDDLIILPALIALTIRLIPADIMERCRDQASCLWEKGKPQKWYYGIPFILIWILVVLIILYVVLF
jgi:uncharacterized membrane protein YkvA (DUF1232 family)